MIGVHGQGLAQAVHDVGAALWFGGSVMGVAGVNKSGADLQQGVDRVRVASSAWARFAPVQWAGVAATVLGGARLTAGSGPRLAAQHGFARTGAAKAAVTAAGAAVTGYAAYSGMRVGRLTEQAHARGEQVVVHDATQPTSQTPAELATWQRRQRVSQYLVPALSGATVVLNALLTQSYRAGATTRGVRERLSPWR